MVASPRKFPLFLTLCFVLPVALAAHNYGEALSKSILFFEAQRSGFLPSSQRVHWRGNSGLNDGKTSGVGDGNIDHFCWQRPEDMTTSRAAYRIDPNHPGSDLAGETAAAMAATSMVFRRYKLMIHSGRYLQAQLGDEDWQCAEEDYIYG